MKNNFLNLLFLFCSLFLITTVVRADEEADDRFDFSAFENFGKDVDEESADDPDYTSICSKYTNQDEKINCCNQAPSSDERKTCKGSLYKACIDGVKVEDRETCCYQKFAGDEGQSCFSYVSKYCDVKDLVRLNKAAAAVKIEYEPVEMKAPGYDNLDSEYNDVLIYALDIKIYNVTPDISILVEPQGMESYNLNSSMNNENGVIVLRDDQATSIKQYTFTIYSGDGTCENKELRKITLSTPKYNPLSDRAACADVPSFYKCQLFTSYDFETGNYVKDIDDYKAKLLKQGVKTSETNKEVNNGAVSKAIKKVSDNKWVVLAVILVIGCAITIIVLKRRND